MAVTHNMRRGLRIGGVAALLLVMWFCRAKPEYPVAEGDALFLVRTAPPAGAMAPVVVHVPAEDGRMTLPAEGDDATDALGREASRPQNPMQASFVQQAPRIVMPRVREGDSERGDLFDLNTLDPEVEKDRAPGSVGWGWLADGVNASTRDSFERLSTGRPTESERRYFNDDDGEEAFGRGFRSGLGRRSTEPERGNFSGDDDEAVFGRGSRSGSGNGSEDGRYFRRQDRRF